MKKKKKLKSTFYLSYYLFNLFIGRAFILLLSLLSSLFVLSFSHYYFFLVYLDGREKLCITSLGRIQLFSFRSEGVKL